jgi:hypothetical protein|nr:MAG TPA: hypothetical protein [Caudoviricetes sp.]
MGKYVIKRKIPKYQEAGEVTPIMPGNVVGLQGIGVEPLVSSTRIGFDIQQPDINTIDTSDLNAIVDSNKKVDESGSTDVFDFTTIPYYGADDIGSRFTQMGRGIGRMRSEGYGDLSTGAKTANTITTIASGISGIMGLARNVVSGIASEKGTRTNIRLAQEREARQRRQSQMQYKDGGGVYLGPNNRFDSGSLTGEYLYPLPKSMEDQANVEVEKGEYVTQPGEAPMEAMGQKHADGGTPVSLEQGTKVITDDTTIEPDFAKYIRDTYGIKATPKDTYATLMDRYKAKIGLKSAYDDQKKALEKLKKNDKIDDENTRRLNASVLSKAINDSNDTVNGLEGRFTDFANVIYKEQEDRKIKKDEDTYFAKGGEIDNIISRSMKEYGLTEEDIAEAKKELLKKVAGIRQKMEIGGTSLFGRKLTFRPIENRFNNDPSYFGYQRQGTDGSYGGINTDERLNYYKTFNPVAYDAYMGASEGARARALQDAIYGQTSSWMGLATAENPIIANAEALRDYTTLVSFGGEDSQGNYPEDKKAAYHDRMRDNKLGLFTTSRPMIGLDVVTEEQHKALNDAGITHFSQLFSDKNKDIVNKILGEDMLKMQALRSMKGMEGLDFILDPHKVAPGPMDIGDVEDPDVKLDMPELIDPNTLPNTNTNTGTNTGKTNNGNGNRNIVGGGLDFPEVFRMTPGAVTTEGLERHYAPTVDPVLRSADQYMVEANRAFQSQLDQMGNVPDSQRGALSSNLQAIMSSNIGKYINEVEQGNVAQRTWADNVNARSWADTYDKNIAQRQAYQQRILQGLAINDENWARYFDSVNDEIQQKWNTATTMNTLRSIFGDVKIGPNGQLIADPQGDILSYRRLYPAQEVTKGKKG